MPELEWPPFDPGALVGLVGGVVFFGSWVLQAIETRQAGQPVVSWRFFAMRITGSLLLVVESIRVQSPGLFLVNLATLGLMAYNLFMAWSAEPAESS
ncbi:MAG: lipid-A-disaccharide synthase N-terminal domain-containing protein [Myxococcota bacterium]